MDECRMEGCERPVFVKKHGACVSCYAKMRRAGEVGHVRICSVPDCDEIVQGKGLCDMHYRRLRVRGTVEARTLAERFTAKYVVSDETGCWVWRDSLRTGYGFLLVDGRKQMAHRVGYELHVGPIPEGMQLDHLCRNRTCVNPEHLEPVTPRENVLRGEGLAAKWAHREVCSVCGGVYEQLANRRICRACSRRRQGEYNQRKRLG